MFRVDGVIDGVQIAALVVDRYVQELHAQIADARPWTGDVYGGRVLRYAPAQRAYFIAIGKDAECFLPHKSAVALPPGQHVTLRIERPATRDKAARASLLDHGATSIGLLTKAPDVSTQLHGQHPVTPTQPLADYEHLIHALLQPRVLVQDGLNLVIEQTAALAAIDVNNADPGLMPLAANQAAARALMRQMTLRNLGGQVLIDFLRLRDAQHRAALQATLHELKDSTTDLYGFTRLGLYELTRTRPGGLSLAEVFALAGPSAKA